MIDAYKAGNWQLVVQPIVAKCEVGAAFGRRVVFTRDGANALGKLIKEMAEKLDAACSNEQR